MVHFQLIFKERKLLPEFKRKKQPYSFYKKIKNYCFVGDMLISYIGSLVIFFFVKSNWKISNAVFYFFRVGVTNIVEKVAWKGMSNGVYHALTLLS